ncbi:signal recognition particle-docking protein FtsY [Pseudonocardia humida]|uniref:Signal recognition particle receptor FtsY n=1 Tax=Pseudonocardia humida TaxID=2800819 RepID=A0ABT0ZUE4_9PSEU|nr:signal recognition particle-docking protein FtsY [Pseudonocardia humida]MCO1654352.1 signal recognition particle-docking protein FtsY [Pseudonocardia humida]
MTTQTLWIVIAVVVAVLIVAVGLGLWLRSRRRISLRESDRPGLGSGTGTTAAPPRRGGTYTASGGFDFAAGGAADTEPPPVGERPAGATREDVARPAEAAAAPTDVAPVDEARVETAPADTAPADAAPADTAAVDASRNGAAPVDVPPLDPARVDVAPTGTVPAETAPAGTETAPAGTETAPAGTETAPAGTETAPADTETAPAEAAPVDVVPPAAPQDAPTDGTPFPSTSTAPEVDPDVVATGRTAPPEEIPPAEGRLERLRGRLARSRSGFGQGLLGLLGAGELDEESWEDVETMLLQADLGPEMTIELVETLRTELARRAVRTTEQARTLLREVLTDALRTDLDRRVRALPHDGRPAVMLVVGVNGTGKTTTTGKLARVLVGGGHHVVLGAADTFRAAAAEQLATWGERAGATVVRGAEGADPASVAFDAVKQGTEEGADVVLLDTAGRLHTKTGLMDELGKVKRVVERQAEVDEVLLVLDATTGQNGLTQARVFGDVVKVTGIALTKLDGTAKGGIVFRVQRELGVPVKLVGLGEGPDDLAPFEPGAFVDALLAT